MNPDTQALTKIEDTPQTLMRRATDVAGVCKEIVTKTALAIQGKRYVRVEGWEAIATAHGCVAGARDVEKIEGGFRALGEIRRADTGALIATAEGFVGDDEKMWAARPEYARRAMAQTRAISRACRSCFAHVVVLIDTNLSTTPAEEVPQGGFQEEPKRQTVANGETKATCRLVDVREVAGEKNGKPWLAWFAAFEDASGQKIEAGTFDRKLADKLLPLKGELVQMAIKPGRRQGKFELVSIDPAEDDLPMGVTP